jgi:hypothetical protein
MGRYGLWDGVDYLKFILFKKNADYGAMRIIGLCGLSKIYFI